MAYATPSTTRPNTGIAGTLRLVLARLADQRNRRRVYSKTYRELEQMTDRDLADIGIPRFMIADIAAEAAARA